jgi:hypothetical protein
MQACVGGRRVVCKWDPRFGRNRADWGSSGPLVLWSCGPLQLCGSGFLLLGVQVEANPCRRRGDLDGYFSSKQCAAQWR